MHYTDTLDPTTVQVLASSMMGRGKINYRYYETMPRGRENDLVYRKHRDWKWGFWNGLPWCEIKAEFYADGKKCLIPTWVDEKMGYPGMQWWLDDCKYHKSLTVSGWRPGQIERFIARFNERMDANIHLNAAGRLVVPMYEWYDDLPRWTPDEVAILTENVHLSAAKLHELLPKHSVKGIYCKRFRL